MLNKQSLKFSLCSNYERGQSLLEVVIALAVIVIIVGALTFATISSIRNAQVAKARAQATKLAQEGIEWVRTGRDRNQSIAGMASTSPCVDSWNASNTNCSSGNGSIWSYQITGSSSTYCNYTALNKQCYFNISFDGKLTYLGGFTSPPAQVESIPPVNKVFSRMILLSDDASYASKKTVTVVVSWNDFSGTHESRLTTILRKL